MALFDELYAGCLDCERLNYAFVVLIPKKSGANRVGEFRPISLLNVVYKILTKVLTNRLNTKLDLLVDKVQFGFMQGRFILDGVVIAQELISYHFRENIKKGLLLKLDFAKAYDMLD